MVFCHFDTFLIGVPYLCSPFRGGGVSGLGSGASLLKMKENG